MIEKADTWPFLSLSLMFYMQCVVDNGVDGNRE